MVKACVLVCAETDKEPYAVENIRKIKGVKEVSRVYGLYDIVVEVNAGTVDEVKDVKREIRGVEYVTSTLTLLATESE